MNCVRKKEKKKVGEGATAKPLVEIQKEESPRE